MKIKADKLFVYKLVRIPVDLSKLSHLVKIDVLKKYVYNAKTKNIGEKIHDNTLNAKIFKTENEISRINNSVKTATLTTVEN